MMLRFGWEICVEYCLRFRVLKRWRSALVLKLTPKCQNCTKWLLVKASCGQSTMEDRSPVIFEVAPYQRPVLSKGYLLPEGFSTRS
ncbi:hypothetical protein BUALT_Bualt05G0080700 [Buddleja alternifolia]|uniref:Uncharacterized protein n=1 Tax=Buddleja alternifolia TaxID=168488 RepID=A0AAV6XPH6_9LAMI|nr:hypothetical protein BUALT_Bualt05G0080700 [Buddleja alternifolia]